MALHFIYGNAGSGKSEYIYTRTAQMAADSPYQRFYVVVPEQATMQAQKSLVEHSGKHAIMNIDVVSFERLAYRVFDELGVHTVVMEETGKSLLLRKIAEEKIGEMTVLRGNIRRMGYIDEIKSMISELMQYEVDPDQLCSIIKGLPAESGLRYKLQDIALMFRTFLDYLGEDHITAERVLDVLSDYVEASSLLKGAVFVFDGYTGFTPVQTKLLHRLMQVSSDIYVTVTLDAREELYKKPQLQNLFYMSHKMTQSLVAIAREEHTVIGDAILIAPHDRSRLSQAPALHHLEQNLFRVHSTAYDGEVETWLRLYSLADPREELEFAASEICRLMRSRGYRFSDFAIVSADADTYARYADQLFQKYEIPYFADRKRNVLYHPLTELIRSVLELVESDYSRDSVFRMLRTGLCYFTDEEIDLLENYCIEKGIRGAKKWQHAFIKPSRQHGRVKYSEEKVQGQLTDVNRLRERLAAMTRDVYTCFSDKKSSVHKKSEALYQFLVSLSVEEKLHEQQERFEESGEMLLASEYRQIYKIVVDLLDKFVDLLGEECMDVRDYTEILEAGFASAKVGSIPPGTDCVILGDIERTRLDDIKVLFFLGVNDGKVPKASAGGSILSQYDREILAGQDLELSPTAKEQAFLQRFYLYLNLTKPSKRLYLTCARLGTDGKSIRPSYLFGTMQKLFPTLAVQELSAEELFPVANVKTALEAYLKGLSLARKGEVSEVFRALHHWFAAQPAYAGCAEQFFEEAFTVFAGEHLGDDIAKQLYGVMLTNSVTRLEQYARCAFSHFLSYGLKLADREEYSFEALDMGTMFHEILREYCERLERRFDWHTITGDEQSDLLKEAMEAVVLALPNEALMETERSRYMLERIRRIMERSVWAITEQIRRGTFLPYGYEVEFEQITSPENLNNRQMKLIGKVDRLDTYEKDDRIFVKVIDYKSGNTKFQLLNLYYGEQLQLVVYLNAAMDNLKKDNPGKEIVPAGIFYCHLDDPMIDGGELTQQEHAAKLLRELRPDGLVSLDPDVFRQMDLTINKTSDVIPLTLKADGTPADKGTNGAKPMDFSALQEFVSGRIRKSAEQILQGDIQVSPYRRDGKTGCDYCAYRSVCGFDLKIPGYGYLQEPKLEKEELWARIYKESEMRDE